MVLQSLLIWGNTTTSKVHELDVVTDIILFLFFYISDNKSLLVQLYFILWYIYITHFCWS